jgi:hypothetical protein
LWEANLTGTDLEEANLTDANLTQAKLVEASIGKAIFKRATLVSAKLVKLRDSKDTDLTDANISYADLSEAKLSQANLTNANLSSATLGRAELTDTKLNMADLTDAILTGATLDRTNLTGTRLAYADLMYARYEPRSPPPDPYVAGIKGLEFVIFTRKGEVGLVQLRDLLQKAGLREEERQVTYVIEKGRTEYSLNSDKNSEVIEAVFRRIAFEWPVEYGLQYGRALILLFAIWLLLIPIYWWTIWHTPDCPASFVGVYRTWPKDRLEEGASGEVKIEAAARVERLQGTSLVALGWAAWFSLLSAFHIGFREFSVGTWLSRVHPKQFTLEPTGWVRTVSGLQSLLSLYLLAMWVLTYFGRPFQ